MEEVGSLINEAAIWGHASGGAGKNPDGSWSNSWAPYRSDFSTSASIALNRGGGQNVKTKETPPN